MKRYRKRKLGMFVLSAVVAATSVAGVRAAPSDVIDPDARAAFTIHKYDLSAAKSDGVDPETAGFSSDGQKDEAAEKALGDYALEGVGFTYLKVGDIHTDRQENRFQLVYDIPDALETALDLTDGRGDGKYTSTELNVALADTLADGAEGKNRLERFLAASPGKQEMELTDENGETRAEDLAQGLYLITETKVPPGVYLTTNPFFLSLPMTDEAGDSWFYDVDVYPKNQTDEPELDKLVKQEDDNDPQEPYEDTATGSEGDVMEYLFVSHLPGITSEATYLSKYTFHDKIDVGLTYNQDFSIYFYKNEEDARMNRTENALDVWGKDSPNFYVEYSEQEAMIHITENGLAEINPLRSGMYLTVAYSCTIDSDAATVLGDKGNKNEVQLTWSRTSKENTDTLTDQAKVYVYGLDLQKEFEEKDGQKGNPEQVQFLLKNMTDGYFMTAVSEEEGIFYITDGHKTTDEDQATVFVPAADGRLLINGLEADTYALTEIATDDQYSLLKEPVIIEIDEAKGEGTASAATVDQKKAQMSIYRDHGEESPNARVELAVLNTRSFRLPQTGGWGSLIFTLAGCGSALAGVILVTKKSKKNRKKKKTA